MGLEPLVPRPIGKVIGKSDPRALDSKPIGR